MHGIIFNQFHQYIRAAYGSDMFRQIIEEANISYRFYDLNSPYPDEEFISTVNKVTEVCKRSKDVVLREFGRYIGPGLLEVYKAYIPEGWTFMDLLEQVERCMHKAVRTSLPETTPPILKITRINNSKLEILYSSTRQMAEFGIGIIEAFSEIYNEKVEIIKTAVADGDLIQVTRLKQRQYLFPILKF